MTTRSVRADYERWRDDLAADVSFQRDLDGWQVCADEGRLPVDEGTIEARLARHQGDGRAS